MIYKFKYYFSNSRVDNTNVEIQFCESSRSDFMGTIRAIETFDKSGWVFIRNESACRVELYITLDNGTYAHFLSELKLGNFMGPFHQDISPLIDFYISWYRNLKIDSLEIA